MPSEHQEDRFENQLATALIEAGDHFETERSALVAAGAARGRRLHNRRRAALVGSVAGIALVGVGGALLLPADDAGGRRSVAAGSSTPSPRPDGQLSDDTLIQALEEMLPKGTYSMQRGQGTVGGAPYASLVYDDGKGGARVNVDLGRVEAGSKEAERLTTCPDKALMKYDACTTSKVHDGTLMIYQGYQYPDRRVDTKRWYASLVTPYGHHVTLSEWNAEAEMDAPVTRDQPPLSPAQLKDIVTKDFWTIAIDTADRSTEKKKASPETTASAPPAAPTGEAVQKTLAALLPKDTEVVSRGGEGEYGYVVADDGNGLSLVQINVQPDMSDVEGQLFGADAEVLDDGTKVAVHQGPGEKGGEGVVMWTVDTIRTDGLRVVVSAFNSGAQDTAATRDTPALTIAELRQIALSPEWVQPMGR
ncbi:hypothetical protein AB0I98_12085 [Streptomyces sp. NPDC050211]|uniref:hypothetical protein n=1 Tax=Streptomyces sp. NPDC050211 TaxID=3154932 RepID=UPI00342204E5